MGSVLLAKMMVAIAEGRTEDVVKLHMKASRYYKRKERREYRRTYKLSVRDNDCVGMRKTESAAVQ